MKICIVGVGNIGMRYYQGILKKFPQAEMLLVDKDLRLQELKKLCVGNVEYFSSTDELNMPIDLIVVATSCQSRLSIYKQCLLLKPRYIILEKYLFKSRLEFNASLSLEKIPTFVNQWMYGSHSFDGLFDVDASVVEVQGANWGLACNAVHWIDLLKKYLGIRDLTVGAQSVINEVFASKRPGYDEVQGRWFFEDRSSEKSFSLIDCHSGHAARGLRITVDQKEYHFDYSAITKDGVIVSRFPYFSEQIGGIVEDLFGSGSCCLPTLEESVSQHLLVEDILDTLVSRPNIT
jgi:hypothetical protein